MKKQEVNIVARRVAKFEQQPVNQTICLLASLGFLAAILWWLWR